LSIGVKFEYYPELTEKILSEAIKLINDNKGKWDKPFFRDTTSYLDLAEIKQKTEDFRNDKIKNVIVLGTGGSIQTLLALKHLSEKKVFPVPSSRTVELRGCLEKTTPEDSIVIPISRGGETLDVNSTIGLFLREGYNFLGLSSKGSMNDMLKGTGCPILDVPDLSGRFAGSISNVGIVPAYIAGIDIKNFLEGLQIGYNNYMDNTRNDALIFATYLHALYKKGYKVVFSMPYSKSLEGTVGLLVQEISESTGKDERGLMGAYQAAPLCQHSVLEYLLGGTKGSVIPILWTVDNERQDIILTSSIKYIEDQPAQTIVNFQADATFQALIEQGVPSAKISIEIPLENSIGQLIAFIQSTIYYLCILLDVNWANNPKVIIGKKICNETLSNNIPSAERKNTRVKVANEKFQSFY